MKVSPEGHNKVSTIKSIVVVRLRLRNRALEIEDFF